MSKVCVSVILAVCVCLCWAMFWGALMLSPDRAFDTPRVSVGMMGPGVECRWSEREPQRYWPLVFAYFFCLPFPCSLLSHSSPSCLCSVFHASCGLISKFRLFFIAFFYFLPLSSSLSEQGERCSFSIQMWHYFLSALRSDLWSTVSPSLAQQTLAQVLAQTLELLLQRYSRAQPSYKRHPQIRYQTASHP